MSQKKILIVTSGERTTRKLLRGRLFELLKSEYEIAVASPAEQFPKWKEQFKDVTFGKDVFFNKSKLAMLKDNGISALIVTGNTDTPAHKFDISMQEHAVSEGLPVICIQDFIDAIFHPMTIIPDLYIAWGQYFKDIMFNDRAVLYWDDKLGGISNFGHEHPMDTDTVKVCGVQHFDDYINYPIPTKNEFCNSLGLDSTKLIFTYLPNGELSEWVFTTFDHLMIQAKKHDAQVIVKAHPIRHGDRWIYNLIINKYPDISTRVIGNISTGKGAVPRAFSQYACGEFIFDHNESIHLASILKNSDLCYSIPSTAAIEAMIFDKPVIIDTTKWHHPFFARQEVMKYYWSVIEKYECCDVVRAEPKLDKCVEEQLSNPDKYKVGRAKIIEDFFYKVDGKASERIFTEIKGFLGGLTKRI